MPYAALGAVLAGLLNQKGGPTIDTSGLTNEVNQNQLNNQQLINQLPASVQQLIAQFQANGGAAASNLTNTTNTTGNNLLTQTQNLYGPTSPAVTATLAALKQQDYSTQPATINALKSNLAATGGLQRGGAANAITKATLAPATQFSGQAATVTGQQLQAQQQNVQAALNKIASMDDATAQQIFGMSVAQASQILQSGNQATQTQLADLINNNNNATNQNLNIAGLGANNAYQNAVAGQAGQAGIVNGLVNVGTSLLSNNSNGNSSGGGDVSYNPLTMSTPTPGSENANPANYGIGQ